MADEGSNRKKPRIRKSAPTIREKVDAARLDAEKQDAKAKPKRLRRAAAKVKTSFKKLRPKKSPRLPDNRFGRVVGKIGRVLRRILGWLVPRYFINSWREVKLVTWPSRRETWRLTGAVFIFAVVFGAAVAGVDKGLDEIFKKVILK